MRAVLYSCTCAFRRLPGEAAPAERDQKSMDARAGVGGAFFRGAATLAAT